MKGFYYSERLRSFGVEPDLGSISKCGEEMGQVNFLGITNIVKFFLLYFIAKAKKRFDYYVSLII